MPDDPNNSPAQLTYTLVTLPVHGGLRLYGGAELLQGEQFTQEDINNGGLRYYDYGSFLPNDQFKFTVTDGEGGYIGTYTFQIFLSPLSTDHLSTPVKWALHPNPAKAIAYCQVEQTNPVAWQIELINANGQVLLAQKMEAQSEQYAIPLNHLPTGIYFVRLSNPARSIGKKTDKRIRQEE